MIKPFIRGDAKPNLYSFYNRYCKQRLNYQNHDQATWPDLGKDGKAAFEIAAAAIESSTEPQVIDL